MDLIKTSMGTDSIYWQYCSGSSRRRFSRAWQRLMNLMGGYPQYYGSYSNAHKVRLPSDLRRLPEFPFPEEILQRRVTCWQQSTANHKRPSGGGKGFQIDVALYASPARRKSSDDPAFMDTCTAMRRSVDPLSAGDRCCPLISPRLRIHYDGLIDQAFPNRSRGVR